MKEYPEILDRIQQAAEASSHNEIIFIQSLVEILVWGGFDSARFYESIKDPILNTDVLVLRAFCYSSKNIVPPIGMRIPYHLSTLGSSGANLDLAFGDPDNSPEGASEWIGNLALKETRWVDVAIRDFKGELYGLIAMSVTSEYVFEPHEFLYLRLLKNAVAQYESGYRLRQVNKLRDSIVNFFRTTQAGTVSAKFLAETALRLALPASGGQICAIFQYDWANRQLRKVAESECPKHVKPIAEAYYVGQYLTGAAWENPDLRHIPHFQGFCESRPNLVFKESVDFHTQAIGGISSLLYEPFGHRHLRFMARVMNRRENPLLPLNYSSREALVSVCDELSELADAHSHKAVIKEFERLSASGFRNITDHKKSLAICIASFEALGFSNTIALYRGKTSSQFELLECGDERLRKHLSHTLFPLSQSSFLTATNTKSGMKIARLSDFDAGVPDVFLDRLRAGHVVAVITSTSLADHGAVIAIKCIYSTEAKLSPNTRLFDVVDDEEIFPSLSAILGSVIEGSRSNVSAEFAEKLVAHFGHEVATPVTKLGSKSISGLNKAIKALKDHNSAPEVINRLEEAKEAINHQSHHITHQMRSAIALADRSFGSIDVKFVDFRLDQVVDDAWEEAMDWRGSSEGRSAFRNIVLRKNPAILKMRLVGDVDQVRAILNNLFKNAIKYSLPRHPPAPMEVRVVGQPQTGLDIVEVQNWGIGIPSDKLELIFGKFIRVEREDRYRSIGGMGLGLFIARLYARVHGGELFCAYSRPTLNDPERIKELEGFLTSFELRIPKTLAPAVRRVKLSD